MMAKRRHVRVSYLPGFKPPVVVPDKPKTQLPFLATIVTPKRSYEVEVGEGGMRLVRHL